MRQPVVVRLRTARPSALLRRTEAEMETASARIRLALDVATLLVLGWSATCAILLAGSY